MLMLTPLLVAVLAAAPTPPNDAASTTAPVVPEVSAPPLESAPAPSSTAAPRPGSVPASGLDATAIPAPRVTAPQVQAAPQVLATPHVTSETASADHVFMTQTEKTLPGHTLRLSDQNVIWLGLHLGVTDRLQLSVNGAFIPVPLAGGTAFPFLGVGVVGGAGVGAVGAFDLGVKYHLLDQRGAIPGVAVGYDLVDGYVAGAGIAGLAVAGGGVEAAVLPGAGFVNAQLNLAYAVAGYDLGAAHLSFGALVVDNHPLLPQSARFGAAAFAAGSGGAAATTNAGGKDLDTLPTEVFPFASGSIRAGEHTTILLEVLGAHGYLSPVATTGARWTFGKPGRYFDVEAAAVWSYLPPNQDHAFPLVGVLPWIGVGGTIG